MQSSASNAGLLKPAVRFRARVPCLDLERLEIWRFWQGFPKLKPPLLSDIVRNWAYPSTGLCWCVSCNVRESFTCCNLTKKPESTVRRAVPKTLQNSASLEANLIPWVFPRIIRFFWLPGQTKKNSKRKTNRCVAPQNQQEVALLLTRQGCRNKNLNVKS